MADKLELFNEGEINEVLLDQLCKEISEEENRTAILNLPKLQQMQLAYAIIKNLTESKNNIKLSYNLNKPYKSMGFIELEGKVLEFDNPTMFSFAMSLADNTEIYPLLKNKVHINFTFHNLTTPID